MQRSMPLDEAFRILSVPFGSTPDEIKRVYRKLALRFHPDVNKNSNATKQFVRVNKAYRVAYNFAQRDDRCPHTSPSPRPQPRRRKAPQPPPNPKPVTPPQSFLDWKLSAKGNMWCEFNGRHVVLIKDRHCPGIWSYVVDGEFSKIRFLSEQMAKEAVRKVVGCPACTKG